MTEAVLAAVGVIGALGASAVGLKLAIDANKQVRMIVEKVLLRDAIAHDQLARNRVLQENLAPSTHELPEPPPPPHVWNGAARAVMLGDPPFPQDGDSE